MDRDYQSESVVYGCIKNVAPLDSTEHRRSNRQAFVFETDGAAHRPNESAINIRCEWARDIN